MNKIIENKISELKDICFSLDVKKLYIFGSVNSVNFRDDSDIDFLLSFEDNLSIERYTNNYFDLQYKLRELFNRDIDIVTERTLSNPYFIKSIDESKKLIYEN